MTLTSRERVQAILNHEMPDRVPIILGASNATGIKMKPYQGIKRIAGIQARTLIVHARDDRLQQFHNAEFAQRTIAGSQLVEFERGGHLVLAVEQARIRALVARQLGAEPAP